MTYKEELERKIQEYVHEIKEITDFSKGVLNRRVEELRREIHDLRAELEECLEEEGE